jgi:hypothetical protein
MDLLASKGEVHQAGGATGDTTMLAGVMSRCITPILHEVGCSLAGRLYPCRSLRC